MGVPPLMRLFVADLVRTARGVSGDAILVHDGTIVELGQADRLRSANISEERLSGGVLLPGLRDAHIHPVGYASTKGGLLLDGVPDISTLLSVLADADAHLDGSWALTGSRLDEERLSDRRLPTRHDLDTIVTERPVFLTRVCGHIGVANTAALDAAGIGPHTPDPAAGSFDRDADGNPNGILRETAIGLVASVLRTPPVDAQALLETMRHLAHLGLTSLGGIVEVSGSLWTSGNELEMLADIASDLPLRVHGLVIGRTPDDIETAAHRIDRISSRLRFGGAKEFADGSLGGHTAALWAPYADKPEVAGTLRLDLSETLPRIRAALALDGSAAIHAIGDRGTSHVLDVFASLIAEGTDPTRLRMEHASMLDDDDLRRMAEMGVGACIQPAFVPSDGPWLEQRLGARRAACTYRFATMARNGVRLAGGSDAPVEAPSPLAGMAAARDRAGLWPEESLTANQAFALFTDDAARLLGEPEPLAPGSPADFIVLDRDPVTASPAELREASVLSTWVGGRKV
ncbi:MAG: amidohydrolase family protein [Gammaproteobacteria bacterium]|nr:amidohydrolase family protein [Gammaproteobacteria bacterium]